jgi:NADPH-dependent 2,4-dienoyl-CoA reductase/sulfur reductase-like enzyme
MTRFVIIGGSDAGISAALRARELDAGCDISLIVADRFPNFSICGIPYFLSGEVARADDLAHRKAADIEAQGIRLLLEHRATRIDPDARLVEVQGPDGGLAQLPYDKLLLGTGAVSIRPRLPGADLPGVFALRWMGDTLKLAAYLEERRPRQALIIGGGYIGMEMAEALIHRGLAVTVVEAMPSVMTTLDRDLGERVGAELTRHGVEVLAGTRIEAIEPDGDALAVHGSGGLQRRVDLVLTVIGARAETALGAAAGVHTGLADAFKVSRRMETNRPDIYAAGDCVETWHRVTGTHAYLPLGTTSHKQGRIAGENAVGGHREFQGSVGTQSVRLFDLVAARTGLHDADARAAELTPLSVDSEHWDHKVYYPGAKRMLIRVTGEADTGRLLGAQIIGAYGTEVSKRVDIFAAALHQGMQVEDLNDLDLSYTPPLSSPWDPVQMAAQAWVQRWRCQGSAPSAFGP